MVSFFQFLILIFLVFLLFGDLSTLNKTFTKNIKIIKKKIEENKIKKIN